MIPYDVRRTNDGIDRLMAVTTNPRHRFMLQAYYRHRFLEIAGRYEEIFAPDMIVANPVYHFKAGGNVATLTGTEAVKGFYGLWAQTHQSIFYAENEQVSVADNYIASVMTIYQQTHGKTLLHNGLKVDDENSYYLLKVHGLQMIWPYDDNGLLVGEDVWEPEPATTELIKLDPADVVTTEQSAKLLEPFIKPLPKFDPATMRPAVASQK